MRLSADLRQGMLEHARKDLPNECCGMLGGKPGGDPQTLYPATNSEASPLRYSLDPADQFRIMKEMEEAGEDLLGIYHSHTKSAAYPSQTDINLATYPGVAYLIISLAEGEQDPIRAFDLSGGEVVELELSQ